MIHRKKWTCVIILTSLVHKSTRVFDQIFAFDKLLNYDQIFI